MSPPPSLALAASLPTIHSMSLLLTLHHHHARYRTHAPYTALNALLVYRRDTPTSPYSYSRTLASHSMRSPRSASYTLGTALQYYIHSLPSTHAHATTTTCTAYLSTATMPTTLLMFQSMTKHLHRTPMPALLTATLEQPYHAAS
jgi:hypothetical protein